MTRVSDRAEFAAAVAEGGALPFLALALMRGPEVDALLTDSARLLEGRPWGVGILGFVPPELRAEQLEVIRAHRPPFALIAGGRPDQARALEAEGITTYLHVPSPGLLELYLARRRAPVRLRGPGVRRPRRPAVELRALGHDDARPARAVAAAASSRLPRAVRRRHPRRRARRRWSPPRRLPASERGVNVGVLLGTAYLFTQEASSAGRSRPASRRRRSPASGTVLLESGPGHATRCLPSPFAEEFEAEKRRLRDARASPPRSCATGSSG